MKVSFTAFLLGAASYHGVDAFAPVKQPMASSALKMVRTFHFLLVFFCFVGPITLAYFGGSCIHVEGGIEIPSRIFFRIPS